MTDNLARNISVILGFILVYIVVNFEFGVGTTFALLLFLGWQIFVTDKKVSFPIVKGRVNWTKTILYTVGAYAALIGISSIILPIVANLVGSTITDWGLASTIQFIIQTKSALFSQITPALAENLLLTFLTWAILISAVETISILGRGFEWATEIFRIKSYRLNNPRMWFVMLVISLVFMLFHLTALGVTDVLSLSTVLIFGIISVGLVVLTGQLLEAILFHILANSIAIVASGQFTGVQITTFWWLVIGMIGLFFILSRKEVRRRIPLLGG